MAANFDRSDDDEVISSINIIPFVDIVLVLLIIFMVTSTAIVKAALKVELPKAAAAGSEVETTLNIVYTLERELILDGDPIDRDRLASVVRSRADASSSLQVVISADTGVAYGDVVGLIDLVKQNGAKAFALNIEREAVAAANARD